MTSGNAIVSALQPIACDLVCVDGELAITDGEDGDVDRIDEMAGDAAGHRGHTGSRERVCAGDWADLRLARAATSLTRRPEPGAPAISVRPTSHRM